MKSNDRKTVEVVFDGDPVAEPMLVGMLHFQPSGQGGIFSFEYSRDWLKSKLAFDLDPGIAKMDGLSYAGGSNFGIFLDSSPDRWGRVLMERREIERARREVRRTRALTEWDFLIGVNDRMRIGALRFRDPETGHFVSEGEGAIPHTSLQEIMQVARHVEDKSEDTWVSLLVAPGSSLGGARPKANYIEPDGSTWIAKFPNREDRYDVAGFEYLLSILAKRAGLDVPESRLMNIGDHEHRTFCLKRFDRGEDGRRKFYMSAMTAAGAADNEGGSYLDIAQTIMDHGARGRVEGELMQLFRRMVFNAMVGNIDDHLRNHGFLGTDSGLVLSPAFDMNPSTAREAHAITFDGGTNMPDLQAVLDISPMLRLDPADALRIVQDIADVVSGWRGIGRQIELNGIDMARMEPAFASLDQVPHLSLPAKSRKRSFK